MTRTQINWSKEEDQILLTSINSEGRKNWKFIATLLENKTPIQCFYRFRKINPTIVKTKWTSTEDNILLQLHDINGNNWSKISKIMKSRGSKQIRDRFINNLDPKIKRGNFTIDEDLKILKLKNKYGNKWALISKHFEDRSPDIIKSRYYSSVKNKKELLFFLESLDNDKKGEGNNNQPLSVGLPINFSNENSNLKKNNINHIHLDNNINISNEKTNFFTPSEHSSEINCISNLGKFSDFYECEENIQFNEN